MNTTLLAQGRADKQKPGNHSFEQFLNFKTHFMLKEMDLPAADSAKFVPLYKELQQEKGKLMRKYRGGRNANHQIQKGGQIPDSVYLKAVYQNADLQIEDAKLDRDFLNKLAKVLKPKQLYKYQEAERKFRDNLTNQYRDRKHKREMRDEAPN